MHTIEAVLRQKHRPVEWVIVDDGSTDNTANIAEEAALTYPWIKVVRRKNRGFREPGRGVVEAFYDGLNQLTYKTPDFICKMDGDLEFDADYFETLIRKFIDNPQLGMASGATYLRHPSGKLIPEKVANGFVVGPIKLYRRSCLEDIGGLEPHLGWDSIDVYRARMRGWETTNFPGLKVIHLRQMGTARGIVWGKIRTGMGDYYIGSHPLFVAARCLYRMTERPFVVNGLSIGLGFLRSFLRREPRIEDPKLITFLRNDQVLRLRQMLLLRRREHGTARGLAHSDGSLNHDSMPTAAQGAGKAAARVNILGIQVDRVGMKDTISRIDQFIANRKPHIIVTPNVDHLIKARKDAEFKRIYDQADLAVPDGVPLLWAARFLGKPLVERVNGTDLFKILCAHAARSGYRVFFLGAAPGVAAKAARNLEKRYPGLNVVGTYSPPFDFFNDFSENQHIEEMIRAARPDILFVGLGAPKQEKWMHRRLHKLQVPVCVGIGASFEYVAGATRRAPQWMQKKGLEWLFRVLVHPGRYWKRYLVDDIKFFPLVLTQRLGVLAEKRKPRQAPLPA
jgi:N-acetylglucosaminyldiphosphoundecaprenol N-acetyl-beta-D-mannosaminyltransferase